MGIVFTVKIIMIKKPILPLYQARRDLTVQEKKQSDISYCNRCIVDLSYLSHIEIQGNSSEDFPDSFEERYPPVVITVSSVTFILIECCDLGVSQVLRNTVKLSLYMVNVILFVFLQFERLKIELIEVNTKITP